MINTLLKLFGFPFKIIVRKYEERGWPTGEGVVAEFTLENKHYIIIKI